MKIEEKTIEDLKTLRKTFDNLISIKRKISGKQKELFMNYKNIIIICQKK